MISKLILRQKNTPLPSKRQKCMTLELTRYFLNSYVNGVRFSSLWRAVSFKTIKVLICHILTFFFLHFWPRRISNRPLRRNLFKARNCFSTILIKSVKTKVRVFTKTNRQHESKKSFRNYIKILRSKLFLLAGSTRWPLTSNWKLKKRLFRQKARRKILRSKMLKPLKLTLVLKSGWKECKIF